MVSKVEKKIVLIESFFFLEMRVWKLNFFDQAKSFWKIGNAEGWFKLINPVESEFLLALNVSFLEDVKHQK